MIRETTVVEASATTIPTTTGLATTVEVGEVGVAGVADIAVAMVDMAVVEEAIGNHTTRMTTADFILGYRLHEHRCRGKVLGTSGHKEYLQFDSEDM